MRSPAALVAARRRLDPQALRAAWWALGALRNARRDLAGGKLREVVLAAPPPLSADSLRGVHAVLRRRPNSCLERSLVLQRWLAAHGRPVDVIIGVTSPSSGFRAHAWLDGEPIPSSVQLDELLRLSP